jgi:ferredoxin
MADVANKFPQNVPGRFYVDDQCIDCDLCRDTAPANFARDPDGGIHSSANNQTMQTKKRFAEKQWKAAQWRRSETTENKTDTAVKQIK